MAEGKANILVTDDEKSIRNSLKEILEFEGYEVYEAENGAEALDKVRSAPPDLVILDVMMPKMSGREVLTEMRADPRTASVPVLMLTAKSEDSDVVVGLQLGADDYVTKPFSMSVLMARVATILRRKATPESSGKSVLTVGPIRIDQERHLVEIAGQPVTLTLTEFRILVALAAARERVLTRNQLIDQAMGIDAVVTDRTIDVHLTALRRKLGDARRYVRTVRGLGYRLTAETDEA